VRAAEIDTEHKALLANIDAEIEEVRADSQDDGDRDKPGKDTTRRKRGCRSFFVEIVEEFPAAGK